MSVFQVKKVKEGLFYQTNTAESAEQPKAKIKEQLEAVIKILKIAMVKPAYNESILRNTNMAFMLFSAIIGFSLPQFSRAIDLPEKHILFVDAIAKRYAQRPSVFAGLDGLCAVMYDNLVGTVAISHEVKEQEKILAKIKTRRRR
ncbi:hypothetical protein NO1_1732 [Candidatus Termititenax aidoneus]|uniref:Uncharacterized protein n=1 Tax=Termititenax aidoneus TaxID=2218524 RepID=A0A388TDF2_TERA1|nr:hypothetical protein NO1_1732 [Candidatus Termititenax aidoneus]